MPKKQSTKQRTKVKDLPKKEKKLSADEKKKVKGGLRFDWGTFDVERTKSPTTK